MDEQQMQFADPEWQPTDNNRQSGINLDPREQPGSFETATEEYAFQNIPYHERDKLEPQRRTRRKVLFIVIPALILIVCLVLVGGLVLPFASHISSKPVTIQAQPAQQGIASLPLTQVLPVHNYIPTDSGDNEPIVVISQDVGSVYVHIGGLRDSVIVTATERDAKGNFEGTGVTASEGGPHNNTITIIASRDASVSPSSSIDLNITVPVGSSIQITEGSGDVQVEGASADTTQANAQVNITSGSVEISGILGGTDVQSRSAPVVLRDLGGTISATTVNASINATRLSGGVTLNSSTGSIVASNVRWGGSISTGGSGSITLSNATMDEQTLLTTNAGNINFQGTIGSGANVQFESGNGAMTIELPTSSTFHLDFSSTSGTLKNDFGSNDAGSGRPAILQITTGSGLIHVEKQ